MAYNDKQRKQGGVGGSNSTASANLSGVSNQPESNVDVLPGYPTQFGNPKDSSLPPPTAKVSNGLRTLPFTPAISQDGSTDLHRMEPSFTRPINAIYSQKRGYAPPAKQDSGAPVSDQLGSMSRPIGVNDALDKTLQPVSDFGKRMVDAAPAALNKVIGRNSPSEGSANNYPNFTRLLKDPSSTTAGIGLGSNAYDAVQGVSHVAGKVKATVGSLLESANNARLSASKSEAAQNIAGLAHSVLGDATFPKVNVGSAMHSLNILGKDPSNHKPLPPSEIARADSIKDATIKKAALSSPTSAANNPTETNPVPKPIDTSEADAATRAKNMAILGYGPNINTESNFQDRQDAMDSRSLDIALRGGSVLDDNIQYYDKDRIEAQRQQDNLGIPIDASKTPVDPNRRTSFDNAYVKERFGGDVKPNTGDFQKGSLGTFQTASSDINTQQQQQALPSIQYRQPVRDTSYKDYLMNLLSQEMSMRPGDPGYSGNRIKGLQEMIMAADKDSTDRYSVDSTANNQRVGDQLDYQKSIESNKASKGISDNELLKAQLGIQKDERQTQLEYDKLNAEQARAALGSLYSPNRDMALDPAQNLAMLKQYTKKKDFTLEDLTAAHGGKLPDDRSELMRTLANAGASPVNIEDLLNKIKQN